MSSIRALSIFVAASELLVGFPTARAEPNVAVVFAFEGTNGSNPTANLVNIDGTLYGTTRGGGTHGQYCSDCGTVFELTTHGPSVIYYFGEGMHGFQPQAGLIELNGSLYSTTSSGGAYGLGTVFKITTNGTEALLHSFDGVNGSSPMSSLVIKDELLYGTNQGGGANDKGDIFSVSETGALRVLYSFRGPPDDGRTPTARLLNVDGSFYGTTSSGGAYGLGTVFKVTSDGTETLLHSFGSGSDGAIPVAGLTYADRGLYGTTRDGGANGRGTVFKITLGGIETVLHSFGSGGDGAYPMADLIIVNGVLYGTISGGGAGACGGCGTVFEMTTEGVESWLHSFGGGIDGANPGAGLVVLGYSLYGTTFKGGAPGKGTVFKVSP
jgi:uncharacterized repeat protein (TIGR03803 family)